MQEEETSFLRTLGNGITRFEEYVKRNDGKIIDGFFAFELYDTFGFPYDLTNLLATEKGLTIDEEAFKKYLQEQKDRSRAATAIDTDDWVTVTNDDANRFVGYTLLETETQIVKYRRIKAKGKEQYQIVLTVTPFYAESGGQVGDTGLLIKGDLKITITDTKKEHGDRVHFADKLPAADQLAGSWLARVDSEKRRDTENNHSATHLLHAALREVLGTHVEQKGSLVNSDALRFDFSHFQKTDDEQLARIEQIVNEKIREDIAADIREMPIDEAKKLGAMALFGEKYGDVVRVVTFDKNYSIELCGGTHVSATGKIGLLKIVSEGAIAAGVRRIEAITAGKAETYFTEQQHVVDQLKELLKNPKDIVKSVNDLLESNKTLEKQLQSLLREKVQAVKSELINKVRPVNGVNFLAEKIEIGSADAIKDLAYELRDKVDNLFCVLGAEVNGKASLTLMISDNIVKEKGLKAGAIIRELAKEIKGGGGGQDFFATSGGADVNGIPKAMEKAKAYLG
jgi:alanyl-tRNA synthetase